MPHSWESSWNTRDSLRVCHIRTTGVVAHDLLTVPGSSPSDVMSYGRLQPFVDESTDFLPRLVSGRTVAAEEIRGRRFDFRTEEQADTDTQAVVTRVSQWLWAVPGGFFQVMTSVDVRCPLSDVILLLEDLYYDDFLDSEIETTGWEQWLGPDGARGQSGEAHQVVFLPSTFQLDWDQAQRLVYRADLDADREHSAIRFPDELNRRFNRGCALTPFVSAFWGQQDYIENSAILSAVQMVSAWARVRFIRDVTYREFAHIQGLMHSPDVGGYYSTAQRARIRQVLVTAQEIISELEGRLTFGVEALQSIMPVIPSLRVESYHRALYDALDLPTQAMITSKMLERLTSAVRSESAALSAVEEHVAETRRKRWAVSVGLLTTIGVPLTILLGFFGAGTSDVRSTDSLFNVRVYGIFYLITVAIIFLALVVHFGLLLRARRQLPSSRREGSSAKDVDSPSRRSAAGDN
jgi:hypothetical protein